MKLKHTIETIHKMLRQTNIYTALF